MGKMRDLRVPEAHLLPLCDHHATYNKEIFPARWGIARHGWLGRRCAETSLIGA